MLKELNSSKMDLLPDIIQAATLRLAGRPQDPQPINPPTALRAGPSRPQQPMEPLSEMENARRHVIAYLERCPSGLPKRDLLSGVKSFRNLTDLQRAQLLHDLLAEGVVQEAETKSARGRPGKRLVLEAQA